MSAHKDILKHFDLHNHTKGDLAVDSPVDGSLLGKLSQHKPKDIDKTAKKASDAFSVWRSVPAPVRGEFVRLLSEELRKQKDPLGKLVTLECGKILSEGLGEIQEMIDICDFAVGLSRQLYGLTIVSERPSHHMREMWHPIGPIGVISAFNFPVAVWSWNAALALVCGNPVVWKPSEKTPLTALACQQIFESAVNAFKAQGHDVPDGLLQVLIGGADVGQALVDHSAFPVISATGSIRMGQIVGQRVAARFGRSILELGGNNGAIICESADLDLALRGVVFAAVGTAGQRCTTTRRLFLHEGIYERFLEKLKAAYSNLTIGNPFDDGTLVGPLIDEEAFEAMDKALKSAQEEGGRLLCGGDRLKEQWTGQGVYARPAIVAMPEQSKMVYEETFAPILYVMKFKDVGSVIETHNAVPQGLSSCMFTNDVREAELFLSAAGSDCGIANVNLGTSGAEIGGAFGGEKQTGGGRESGSDSWKAYMRRQTQTVNYGRELPLAQGVKFDF